VNVEELFNSLDATRIQQFVGDKQEENLHLEFKTLNGSDLAHRDDRKNFAAALSGFANSSGGIVIWGISARKNVDGLDCANEARPVTDCRILVARLNQLTGEAVDPVVDGVRHSAHPTAEPAGFVATLVLESDVGPHMAKAGDDRYYKRSGDSFYRMEHYDIADMFGRRKRPRLHLTAEILNAGSTSGGGVEQLKAKLVIGIENSGRAAARSPYLALRLSEPYRIDAYGIDGNKHEGLPRLVSADPAVVRYGANADTVIHANTVREIASVEINIRRIREATFTRVISPADVCIAFQIAAEDVPLEKGELVMHGDEIRRRLLGE